MINFEKKNDMGSISFVNNLYILQHLDIDNDNYFFEKCFNTIDEIVLYLRKVRFEVSVNYELFKVASLYLTELYKNKLISNFTMFNII